MRTADVHPVEAPPNDTSTAVSAPSGFVAAPPIAAAPLTVWLIDEADCEDYDAFVTNCPQASIYHTLAWRLALLAGSADTPFYLAAMRGDRMVGCLPLVEQVHWLGRSRLVSLPRTPAAGPVAEDAEAHAALHHLAAHVARRHRAELLIREYHAPSAEDTASPTDGRSPIHVRASLSEFAAVCQSKNGHATDTCRHTPLTRDVLRVLPAERRRGSFGVTAAMLCELSRCGVLAECLAHVDATGRTVAAVVWALHGRIAHVLAWGSSGPAEALMPELGRRLADLAAREKAEWIDLPIQPISDSWTERLIGLRGAQLARTTHSTGW